MAAGALIGALRVTLGLDSAAFEKGAGDAERRLGKLTSSFSSMGSRISAVGVGLSAGITAPLALFGKSAFAAASDAEELQATFNSTFGSMSATMNKWATDTGDALGRSTQEMQKAANTFGMFFNQAVDPAKAAQMSQIFSGLAQDLGSFFNVDTDVAIEKLRSGLSGESEPLRDFGVFLTEASVKAKGLSMGLGGVSGELTEQEKILARYQLIMDATTKAQGAATREADSAAGRIRAASAAYDELQVIVGTKLLPVITPLIAKVAEALNWFTQLPAPVQTATVAVAAIGAALGPVAIGLGSIISGASAVLPAFAAVATFFSGTFIPIIATVGRALIGLAIAGGPLTLMVAGATAAYVAWQNWDKIGPIVGRMVSSVKTWLVDTLGGVFNWLKGKIGAVAGWFKWLDDVVVRHSYIPDMVDSIGQHIRRLQGEMVDPAVAANESVATSFANMAERVSGTIKTLASSIKSGDWGSALGGVLDLAQQIGGAFGGKVNVAGARAGANAALDALGNTPGFATGGSFRVGGAPGIDKNLIAFRATRGEMVDIRRPGQRDSRGAVIQIVADEGAMFVPRVAGISGNVTTEYVGRNQRTAAMRGRQQL